MNLQNSKEDHGIRVKDSIRASLRELRSSINSRPIVLSINVMFCVHKFLKSVLLETLYEDDEPRHLYIYPFLASLCVSYNAKEKRYGYKMDLDISPYLSDILHFASIVALVELKGVFRHPREFSLTPYEIRKFFAPGSTSAIFEICQMRSVCARVRLYENLSTTFATCEDHTDLFCGFVNNTHISISELTNTIHCMLKKVRSLIFSFGGLFKSCLTEAEAKSAFGSLADNTINEEIGYWFGADWRNCSMFNLRNRVFADTNYDLSDPHVVDFIHDKTKQICRIVAVLLYLTSGGHNGG